MSTTELRTKDTMSSTPRTEAAALWADVAVNRQALVVPSAVAANLERELNLWRGRAERICNLVLRLNADEGLSAGALAGLQRMANAALGKQS